LTRIGQIAEDAKATAARLPVPEAEETGEIDKLSE
jgi:hypothetical protein